MHAVDTESEFARLQTGQRPELSAKLGKMMNTYLISEELISGRSAVGRLVLFGIENSDLWERRKAR